MIDAANAAGLNASRDEPDSILLADSRNLLTAGSIPDRLAEHLANDLQAKSPVPITREMCAVLVRAMCNLNGLSLLGYDLGTGCTIGAAAAAKLEMRAKP